MAKVSKADQVLQALEDNFKRYKDSYGNYKFVGYHSTFRIKPQDRGLRVESLWVFENGEKIWKNIYKKPLYYKDINIEDFINRVQKTLEKMGLI